LSTPFKDLPIAQKAEADSASAQDKE
jgi:hypothetical protein